MGKVGRYERTYRGYKENFRIEGVNLSADITS
jgi:hypothetical protein